jgi:hypothetical protein
MNKICVYDNLLSDNEIDELTKFIPDKEPFKFFNKHPQLEQYIIRNVLSKIENKYISTGTVSISCNTMPVSLHIDSIIDGGETHKLLIYLNSIGGTSFMTEEGVIEIESIKGRCVVFDISLWHKGNFYSTGVKKTIGLRLKLE